MNGLSATRRDDSMFEKMSKNMEEITMSEKRKCHKRANGEGSFRYYERTKTWTYRLSYKRHDIKSQSLCVSGKSKEICKAKMAEKIKLLSTDSHIQIYTSYTLPQLCQAFFDEKVNDNMLTNHKSKSREQCTINQLKSTCLNEIQICSFRADDAKDAVRDLCSRGLSRSTLEKCLVEMNAAFNWAVIQKEAIDRNPLEKNYSKIQEYILSNTPDPQIIILEEEDVKKLVEVASQKNANGDYKFFGGPIVLLLLNTGMRIGELLGLRWKDFNVNNNLIDITKQYDSLGDKSTTKNGVKRRIELLDAASVIIRELYEKAEDKSEDSYIISRNNSNVSYDVARDSVEIIYQLSGIDFKEKGYKDMIHIFRRTFCSAAYDKGWKYAECAHYIGDSPDTVKKYYVQIKKKKEGIEYVHKPSEVIFTPG